MNLFIYVKDLPEEEQAAIRKSDEQTAKAFEAVEKDRKKHGTRYDERIELECPNCDGTLFYMVSSYNGHRHLNCNGDCKLEVME